MPASPPEHKRDPKEEISLTVDDLNKAADRLLNGDKDAPSVEALADGLGVTLGRGLPESKAGLQDRERRFGANRLPSRDEVGLPTSSCFPQKSDFVPRLVHTLGIRRVSFPSFLFLLQSSFCKLRTNAGEAGLYKLGLSRM